MKKYFIDEIETFAVNEDLKVNVETFGPNETKVVTVDNFYKNPDQVRDLALRIPPSINERIRTRLPGPRINAFYLMDHMGPIFDNILQTVYPEQHFQFPPNHINDVFRDSTFIVNIMHTKFLEPRPPHIDCPYPTAFAAMVFLNTPEECKGGTGFYSFDGQTGGTEFGLYKADNGKPTDIYVNGDMGDWKMHHMTEMKYNRMVIYQANIYHAAYITDDMYNDDVYRLNQMFFI